LDHGFICIYRVILELLYTKSTFFKILVVGVLQDDD